MKRLLAIVFLVIVVLGAWWLFFKTDKPDPGEIVDQDSVIEKTHSDEFNTGVALIIDSYLEMKQSFVNADSTQIKLNAAKFINVVDSLHFDELKNKDVQIVEVVRQQLTDIKSNAIPILEESSLADMRQDFRMVSENMYPFLKTIGYEGEKLYWQHCPMAFGDQGANWLSSTSEIVNPYLGKNHPEYKSTMLHCGETKDSIYLK